MSFDRGKAPTSTVSAIILLAVLAAWTPPASAQDPVSTSLLDSLIAEAGDVPALLVVDESDRIAVRSPDGSWSRQLYADEVVSVSYDAQFELIWFVANSTLYALDLREPDPQPVPIVANMSHRLNYVVRYRDVSPAWTVGYYGWLQYVTLMVDVADVPLIVADGDRECCESEVSAAEEAVLVGDTWLSSQTGRAVSTRVTISSFERNDGMRARILEAYGDCRYSLCGQTAEFGPTGWNLVAVPDPPDFSDLCILYDPATDLFASLRGYSPGEELEWSSLDGGHRSTMCGSHMFDASGDLHCYGHRCDELEASFENWTRDTDFLGVLQGGYRVADP